MQKKGESQRVDVVGVGENSVDVLATVPHWPGPDEKVQLLNLATLPGGQVATALVGCARLGCSTRYLGIFGDDPHGGLVKQALETEGVQTDACLIVGAPNRSAFIIVDPGKGTRAVLWQRDAALRWPDTSHFAGAVSQARALLVDATDVAASTAAARAARAAGVPVFLDVDRMEPGLDGLLRQVDVVIAADGFPQAHTGAPSLGDAMRSLAETYPSAVIVVTLGADGAVAWGRREEIMSPGFVVHVVDPTGAGDAFRAGFLTAWLEGGGAGLGRMREILEFANATAALNCRAVGAQTGLPTRKEVLGLLTDRAVGRSNQTGHGVTHRNDHRTITRLGQPSE